jgi:hypothetical protein
MRRNPPIGRFSDDVKVRIGFYVDSFSLPGTKRSPVRLPGWLEISPRSLSLTHHLSFPLSLPPSFSLFLHSLYPSLFFFYEIRKDIRYRIALNRQSFIRNIKHSFLLSRIHVGFVWQRVQTDIGKRGLLGTLFDPCRLAYLTYTLNDCVRPLLTMNFPT